MSTPRDIAKLLNFVNLDTNKVLTSLYDSDSIVSSANLGVDTPNGCIVASSASTLPTSAPTGQQAFVTSTNRLYVFSGNGWYNIAIVNATPYWDSEAAASYTLPTDGTNIVVEVLARDSDGTTITYTATGDSDFNVIASVARDSDNGRRFTIRPRDSDGSASPTAGSGILTFRASDGIDQASTASTFTISFTVNYNLPSDANFVRKNSVSGTPVGESVLSGLTFNSTGDRFWVCSYSTDNIVEYTLSTAWDTSSSITEVSTNYTTTSSGSQTSPNGLHYDGRYLWMGTAGTSPSRIVIYDLGVGGTMSNNQTSLGNISLPSAPNPFGITVGKNGTKVYVGNATPSPDTLLEYTINSNGSGATDAIANGLTLTNTFTVGNDSIEDMMWNPSGTELFILYRGSGGTGISIYKYTAGTAWDISSLSLDGEATRASITNLNNKDMRGIFLRPSGGLTFLAEQSSGNIFTFAT